MIDQWPLYLEQIAQTTHNFSFYFELWHYKTAHFGKLYTIKEI